VKPKPKRVNAVNEAEVLRVASWNVNGLRACARKGFFRWLEGSGAAIVGIQEVRARRDQLLQELGRATGWFAHVSAADRAGYSGVGLLARRDPDALATRLEPAIDAEGRLQMARFGRLLVVNAYFPNGNGTLLPDGRRSNDRVPYKLGFYQALWERLEPERQAGAPILVLGDFNTAHTEIDLARPKDNQGTSGFLPEERAEFDRWLRSGWVDSFRAEHPGEGGHYSWWAQRAECRKRNIGWRIDYLLASPAAARWVRRAWIAPEVTGSDHCPVGVDLDAAGLEA
jgi:exodeoxyribonuclease-3